VGELAVVATELQPGNTGRSEPKEGLSYLWQELGRYLIKKIHRIFYFGAGHTVYPKRA